MRKLVGVLFLLAGLGLAANVFRTSQDRSASLDQVLMGKANSALRSQSAAPVPSTQSAERKAPASVLQPAAPDPAPTRWQRQEVVVNYESEASKPKDAAIATPPAGSRDRIPPAASDDPRARYELARNLQTELRRVGCYEGEIDGSWGPGSKRAMSAFASQVNASLPTEEPDHVLLKLVQSHREKICGRPCPVGQTVSESGRCVPVSIVAGKGAGGSKLRTAEPAAPDLADRGAPLTSTTGSNATANLNLGDDTLDSRMSVGAPVSEEQKPAPAVSGNPAKPSRSDGRSRSGVGVVSSNRSAANRSSASPSKQWTQTIFNQLSAH